MALDCTRAVTAACAQEFEEFLTASSSSGGDAILDAIENIILSSHNGEAEIMNRIHHTYTSIGVACMILLLITAYVVLLDHNPQRRAQRGVDRLPTWRVYVAIEGIHLYLASIYGLKFAFTIALIVNVAASFILAHEDVLEGALRDPDPDNRFWQERLLLQYGLAPLVAGLACLLGSWSAMSTYYAEAEAENLGAAWKGFVELVFWRAVGEDGFSWLALTELAIGMLALCICLLDLGSWVLGCVDRIWGGVEMGFVSCIAAIRAMLQMRRADTGERDVDDEDVLLERLRRAMLDYYLTDFGY